MRTSTWLVRTLSLACLAVLASATGCFQRSPFFPPETPGNSWVTVTSRAIPSALVPSVDSLVRANTAFACDLYARVAAGRSGNVALAPFSVSAALAMTLSGARTQTAQEMASTLHYDGLADVDGAWRALLQSLAYGAGQGDYTLEVANAAWLRQDAAFVPAFVQGLAGNYDAAAQRADFGHAPEAARADINKWVDARTNGRIPELLKAGMVDEATWFVLVNALYFKAGWLHEFPPARTRSRFFYTAPGESLSVQMMSGEYTARIAQRDGFSIAALPYLGDELGMLFIVPKARDGLADVERLLCADSLQAWSAAVSGRAGALGDIMVPRFNVRLHSSLQSQLEALGMPLAFTQNADLSGIAPVDGLQLLFVEHEAVVTIDEHGTEAAGATAVVGGLTDLPPRVVLDRPFLFAIVDHVTGSVLFLGRVARP